MGAAASMISDRQISQNRLVTETINKKKRHFSDDYPHQDDEYYDDDMYEEDEEGEGFLKNFMGCRNDNYLPKHDLKRPNTSSDSRGDRDSPFMLGSYFQTSTTETQDKFEDMVSPTTPPTLAAPMIPRTASLDEYYNPSNKATTNQSAENADQY